MASSPPRCLRDLGLLARIGVAFVVLTLIGGTAASGLYLYMVKEMRDERAGLTVDDIKGHYHGMSTKAPLLVALESGHPNELTPGDASDELPGDERQALIDWLTGDRLSQDFDNFDLGDFAPSEIMAVSCLDCHSRNSEGEHAAAEIPLEYWDDVEPLSASREISPVSIEILAASTHTHALGLSAVTLVLAWLALLTSWPRAIVGLVVAATGLGLLLDIGGWWLTREWIDFAYLIMGAGAVYNGGMVLLGLLVIGDVLMPAKKPTQAA
jgi:hypothetical protein